MKKSLKKEPSCQEYDFLKLRKTYGLTQSDLGDFLKVSKNYICQIETGRKVPSETLIALATRIERELAESSTGKNLSASGGQATRNEVARYLDKVWAFAGDDRDLQGYIFTKLKLVFPLNEPPFSPKPSSGE